MKSLWIVNKCCGALHQKVYGKKATGGQWLDAMLEEAKTVSDDSIVVVNIEKNPKLDYFEDGNVTYYTLKGESNEKYNYKSQKSVNDWRRIIEKEKPDILEFWGTEFPYALAAMNAAPNLPAIINVQGILDSIAKYYISGLTEKELKQAVTFRDVLTKSTIKQTQRNYEHRAEYECEIVKRAGHIIIESEWAEVYHKKMNSNVKTYFLPISISNSFREHTWNEETMKPHTIMCPAANYPIKGFHMMLKALAIVKKKYPDVHLYVPGSILRETKSIKGKIKENGYERLIKKMIIQMELANNITYTGRLTADEMAQKMSEVNCFAMTSAIENISTTLKEAMTVGTPCVASYVGGITEYATNGENCLVYRYADYEMLANNICRLFEDKELRAKLSKNAVEYMHKPKTESDYEIMSNIFSKVINS